MQQQTAFQLNIHKCREVLNLSYKEHINKVHNEIEPKYVFSKTKFSLQKRKLTFEVNMQSRFKSITVFLQ